MLFRTLKWPVISLLITGGFHFTIEAILPDMKTIFVPAVLAPLLLSFGIWTGYKAVRFGGNYGQVILAGAILGVLPLLLDVVGFGMMLSRGVTVGLLAGIFGFSMVLFGSLIGGGFGLSKE
jgi:hypothetical protein